MKQLTFEEIIPFIKLDRVIKIAKDEVGCEWDEIVDLFSKPEPLMNERGEAFYDAVIEIMDEGEIVDSVEIECLSSYSTTSEFYLHRFGDIYFIKNFEWGDLGYFTSIEDAKKASKQEYGFDWDDPESFNTDSAVNDLL